MWGDLEVQVSPALYENEKKNVRWVFLFLNHYVLYWKLPVGYFLVFPMTLRFLATYELSAAITEQVSLDSYMDNFLNVDIRDGNRI